MNELTPVNILLAFDKFKHAMSAHEACHSAHEALQRSHPKWHIRETPLSDGGEGFCKILTQAAKGKLLQTTVTGPLGKPIQAHFGLVQGKNIPINMKNCFGIEASETLGIIEMAQASGLMHVPGAQKNPYQATSRGTGELLLQAAEAGAQALLLGIGGSASNDLGLGALEAVGLQVNYEDTKQLPISPQNWDRITSINSALLKQLPPLFIACDVNNPLLGPEGATRIYGPQKGIQSETDVTFFETHLGNLAHMLCKTFEQDCSIITEAGSGAAGGIACGLRIAYQATILPGFVLIAQWLDLEKAVAWADIILTGEGRFDSSSLQGKGPGSIIKMALKHNKPVEVFAGCIDEASTAQLPEQIKLHCISSDEKDMQAAINQSQRNLNHCVTKRFQAG